MNKYFRHKVNNLVSVSDIITVHYFEFDKNFCSDGESHNFWELVYAEKESIICRADGKTFELQQGEMYFHKPNEFLAHKANGKTAPNVFIISFECNSKSVSFFNDKKIRLDKKYLPLIFAILSEAKNTFDIPVSDPLSKKMELRKKPSLGGLQEIKNYLEILLINLMREADDNPEENGVFLQDEEYSKKLVNDVLNILKNGIYARLTIADICKESAYSRSQLFKQFRKYTGKSIMEYYNLLKIEKSKQLLRENNLTVAEISDKLCFDSPNYFTKKFKKTVNLTPLKYKKIHSN